MAGRSQEKTGQKTVQQLNDVKSLSFLLNPLRYNVSCPSLLQIIQAMMERLPPYQYFIAFPQLISRICHPNSDVFAKLEVCTFYKYYNKLKWLLFLQAIILKLLQHYPQQCLWMMIAVNKVNSVV